MATQFFVNGAVVGSILPRLPEIRDAIGADVGTLGLVLTLSSLGGLLGSAVCSPIIERFGTKAAMIDGGSALIATLFIIGAARSPLMLWIGLGAMLFFDVIADVAMNMQASAISARRQVPVMNRLHGLWSLGTVLGGILASVLAASEVELQFHLAAVALVLLATMAFVAPGLLPTEDVRHEPETTTGPAASTAGLLVLVTFATLAAMAMVMEQIAGDWSALRLSDDLGQPAGTAALGFVAYTVGMTTGRFMGDAVLVRIGEHRLIRVGVMVNAVGLAIAFLIDLVPFTLVGLVVAGLGNSVLFPMLYDQAAKAPGKAGAGLGAMVAGSRIGALIAPVAVGTMAATDALSVGEAVAIVTIPAAAVILIARTLQANAQHRPSALSSR